MQNALIPICNDYVSSTNMVTMKRFTFSEISSFVQYWGELPKILCNTPQYCTKSMISENMTPLVWTEKRENT